MKDFDIPVVDWFHQVISGEDVYNVFVGSLRLDSSLPVCHPKQQNFTYRISWDYEKHSFLVDIFHDYKQMHSILCYTYDSLLPLLRNYYKKFKMKEY